jgi:hypothetical protein
MKTVVATVFVVLGLAVTPIPGANATATTPATNRQEAFARRAAHLFRARHTTRIAPLTRVTADDPVGDVSDPRADVRRVSVSYNSKEVKFGMHVVQPTDPRTDPAWTSNDITFAGAAWFVSTNPEGGLGFIITFGADRPGHLVANIWDGDGPDTKRVACPSARPSFVKGAYFVTASSSCILDLPRILVSAIMVHGFPAQDNVPDNGSFGPISGPPGGYLQVGADGSVFAFGQARSRGSIVALHVAHHPVIAASAMTGLAGYVMLTSDGGVFAFGESQFAGSAVGMHPAGRYVGIADVQDGRGYWIATNRGVVTSFGMGPSRSSAPLPVTNVVGIAPLRDLGYWLVTSTGGVYTSGDAKFFGAPATLGRLHAPVVAIAPTPTGQGYYVVAADGGVFAYGDATFHGSAATLPLRAPIVGITVSAFGDGYRLYAADGGVFTYGQRYFGAASTHRLGAPIVAAAAL